METLILGISLIARLLTLLIFINALLSFFVSPYHPVREALERLIAPMLNPIRRLLPPMGMIDFSPMVLILLIQLVSTILIQILLSA